VERNIILITGHAGSGKDTTAEIIEAIGSNDQVFTEVDSFANPIKEIAYSLGWDGNKDEKGRQLLIDIGRAGYLYLSHIWAQMLALKGFDTIRSISTNYQKHFLVIPDFRFVHELNYFINLHNNTQTAHMIDNIIVLRIERDEALKVSKHHNMEDPTEKELNDRYDLFDLIIKNNSTKDDLQRRITEHLVTKENGWEFPESQPVDIWNLDDYGNIPVIDKDSIVYNNIKMNKDDIVKKFKDKVKVI